MGATYKGNTTVHWRIPKRLSEQFEEHCSDNCLDRNLMVTLLVAKYLTEQGVVADESE